MLLEYEIEFVGGRWDGYRLRFESPISFQSDFLRDDIQYLIGRQRWDGFTYEFRRPIDESVVKVDYKVTIE